MGAPDIERIERLTDACRPRLRDAPFNREVMSNYVEHNVVVAAAIGRPFDDAWIVSSAMSQYHRAMNPPLPSPEVER